MLSLVVLFKSYNSITLILLFWNLFQNGCQFNMSTNVFFCLSLVSQSGCKTKTFFCFSQEKFKKILKLFFRLFFLISLSISQGTFRVLRGANVKSIFKPHKLFLIFFLKKFSVSIFFLVSISVNVFRCCGCKSTQQFQLRKPFLKLFLIFLQLFLNSLITQVLQCKLF
jgi:hypothetical protein